MCCFGGGGATSPSGHTTLGHDHNLGYCFYNHYFFLFLTMKVQRAHMSKSRDQMGVMHWRVGCSGVCARTTWRRLEHQEGQKRESLHFICISVGSVHLVCPVWYCVLRWLFFFLIVISFAHNRVGASDRRCAVISLIDILVIFQLWLSRRNLL